MDPKIILGLRLTLKKTKPGKDLVKRSPHENPPSITVVDNLLRLFLLTP